MSATKRFETPLGAKRKTENQIQIEARLVVGYCITTSRKQLTKPKNQSPERRLTPRESSQLWLVHFSSPTWKWNVFHFEHSMQLFQHPSSSSSRLHFNEAKMLCLAWHSFFLLLLGAYDFPFGSPRSSELMESQLTIMAMANEVIR